MAKPSVYRWTRDLHLYAGLFLSPIVLLFATSVIVLNHSALLRRIADVAEPEKRSVMVSVPDEENNLEFAKLIQRQIGISGEIDFINRNEETRRASFPITKPGHRTTVRTDLDSGATEIEEQSLGVWSSMIYLHTMPGPHNVSIRGNWIFTRLWGGVADGTVYLLLFLTASGVYLWTILKAERKLGLIFLGTGLLSFFLIVVALTL